MSDAALALNLTALLSKVPRSLSTVGWARGWQTTLGQCRDNFVAVSQVQSYPSGYGGISLQFCRVCVVEERVDVLSNPSVAESSMQKKLSSSDFQAKRPQTDILRICPKK